MGCSQAKEVAAGRWREEGGPARPVPLAATLPALGLLQATLHSSCSSVVVVVVPPPLVAAPAAAAEEEGYGPVVAATAVSPQEQEEESSSAHDDLAPLPLRRRWQSLGPVDHAVKLLDPATGREPNIAAAEWLLEPGCVLQHLDMSVVDGVCWEEYKLNVLKAAVGDGRALLTPAPVPSWLSCRTPVASATWNSHQGLPRSDSIVCQIAVVEPAHGYLGECRCCCCKVES